MADSKISSLDELASIATGDLVPVVDVSDTTQGASGTTKKITQDNLLKGVVLRPDGTVALNNNTNLNVKDSGGTARVVAKMTASDVLTFGGTSNATKIRAGSSTTDGHTVPNVADDTVVLLAATQTLTNKTLTLPTLTNGAVSFNAPQGFLINGKISVTVASNNITVAIKTLAGTDPSATDPVYCRIGDTVRSITAALSVTKNAGTNWCNAGSAELATKEIDYFVYLGYNAIDGMTIGFSRIPYALSYGEFSATTTNEKYCAISTITNAASTDYYENIGRFAATLSAGAGYTWSVPTFTAINLIQRPIYYTRLLTYVPTWTNITVGNATNTANYQFIGINLHFQQQLTLGSTSSVSASNDKSYSLPITVNNAAAFSGTVRLLDSGTADYSGIWIESGGTAIILRANNSAGTYLTMATITSSVPHTWASTDVIASQGLLPIA